MRQIKKVTQVRGVKSVTALLLLGFGMQGHAQIPVTDGANLGTNMQDFMSNVTEFSATAGRWAENIEQWEKEYTRWKDDMAVATTAFDIGKDLMNIYEAVGEISEIATEIQEAGKKFKEGGVNALAKGAFDEVKKTVYKNRSLAVQNSCGERDVLQEQVGSLSEKYFGKTKKGLESLKKLGDKITSSDTYTVKAQSVSVAMEQTKEKIQDEREQFANTQTSLDQRIAEVSKNCANAVQDEMATAKHKSTMSSGGGGLIGGNSSDGQGGSSDAPPMI